MNITRTIILISLLFLVLPIQASVRIENHDQLQDALRDNQPPSGYIDLNQCKTHVVVGDVPEDLQVYRLSFEDNFSFNMTSKIITSVFDTVLNNSQVVKTVPVLVKVPATIFVTSSARQNYIRYQITLHSEQESLIRVYHCPWDQALYLWK